MEKSGVPQKDQNLFRQFLVTNETIQNRHNRLEGPGVGSKLVNKGSSLISGNAYARKAPATASKQPQM